MECECAGSLESPSPSPSGKKNVSKSIKLGSLKSCSHNSTKHKKGISSLAWGEELPTYTREGSYACAYVSPHDAMNSLTNFKVTTPAGAVPYGITLHSVYSLQQELLWAVLYTLNATVAAAASAAAAQQL